MLEQRMGVVLAHGINVLQELLLLYGGNVLGNPEKPARDFSQGLVKSIASAYRRSMFKKVGVAVLVMVQYGVYHFNAVVAGGIIYNGQFQFNLLQFIERRKYRFNGVSLVSEY
jgi:hypothetical protein